DIFSMQSSYMYQLPISNIAYHVCNREEDLDTTQEISRRAFQRTMESYHEHEQLADVFQVELDKQQQLTRERKEREKMLKQNKHKSKRNRSQSQQPHPHPHPHPSSYPHHRHLYSALFPSSSTTHLASHEHPPHANDQKRPRRLSDISNNGNGYGSNAARMPKAQDDDLARSSPNDPSRSSDRSQSSTPAYPLTPSPRLSPSSHPPNDDASGSAQPNTSSSSTPSKDTPFAAHTPPSSAPNLSSTVGGIRKKRKQAIPIRSSVIDRIPGITLRIQPDRQGEQLQVEILKNLEDYPRRSSEANEAREPNDAPPADVQAKQDMAKIKESIESGRPGYAMFPPGHFGSSHSRPDLSLAHAYRDFDLPSRSSEFSEGRGTTKEKMSSSLSLEWMSSMESLLAHHELLESRAQPLSWETFSTRECVMNKVTGKHDQDLELLEEVVQDAVARQHYNNNSPSSNDRDSEPTNSPTTPQRKSSASTHANTSRRPSKPPAEPAPSRSHAGPIRTTRSRTHGNEKDGKDEGPQLVEAHEDIELILKEKRRKKRQERERLSSRASSTATHIDGDDDDDHDSQTRESSMDKSADHDMDETHSDDDEDADGDVRMVNYKQVSKRGGWDENDSISEVSLETPNKSSKRPQSEDSRTSSAQSSDESSDDDNDAEDDPDYKNRNVKSAAIAPRSQAMRPPQKPHEDKASRSMTLGTSDPNATPRSRKSSISSTPPLTPTKPIHEPSNKTRARAKSFQSTITISDTSNFYESALAAIANKRKETIARKRAEGQKREADAKAEDLKRENAAKAQELKREAEANTQRQLKELQAQKIEASNLPKSSKSLPGRVLRRTRLADATDSAVDPDCTSCRLELSPSDKIAWKSATEDGEIKLPKTWGSHAILCTACRLQYLDHHTRCTACFYVPVKEEMDSGGSSCGRCKFGTWLNESAHIGASSSRHRKSISDATL
ncbi:hypothetical protein CPC16_011464, partial [Podila verticillata]